MIHIKLKTYLIDLIDNHDVTGWIDMSDEYRAKCWELLKDSRSDWPELVIEIMNFDDEFFDKSEEVNPYREDISCRAIGISFFVAMKLWLHDKVGECLAEINLEREERAIDNSHEDAERTPERTTTLKQDFWSISQ